MRVIIWNITCLLFCMFFVLGLSFQASALEDVADVDISNVSINDKSIAVPIETTPTELVAATAELQATYSGTCGDNLTWSLDTGTGILTISGKGTMTNWSTDSRAPWYSYCNRVKTAAIGTGVTSIGNYAFNGCRSLTSVSIPDSVTSIGNHAFNVCSSRTSVSIPDSVTRIGSAAFSGCSGLQSITLPFVGESRKTANETYQYPLGYIFGRDSDSGSTAVSQCRYSGGNESDTPYYIPSTLRSVTIKGGQILEGAFENCSMLTSITIPDSVTSIGSYAFYGCSSLTSIKIPGGITSIGNAAFYNCRSLTSITIPDSVTSIRDSAFYNCQSLTSITIPNGVTSIDYNAFGSCVRLQNALIPDSVMSIGEGAFCNCVNLRNITLPFVGESRKQYRDTNQYPLGWIFGRSSDASSILRVTQEYYSSSYYTTSSTFCIPSSLRSVTVTGGYSGGYIPYGAFMNCSKLTDITLGDGVTEIADSVFSGCIGLTNVTLGRRLTKIPSYTFDNCTELKNITLSGNFKKAGYNAFGNCYRLTDVWYDGSEAMWNAVDVGNNEELLLATKHYLCSVHQWENESIIRAATCVSSGEAHYVCSICGLSKTESIPALGHDLIHHSSKAPTCTTDGNNAYDTCSRCEYSTYQSIPATGHSWNSGAVTTAATCTATGIKTYTCMFCRETYTEPVVALGHNLEHHNAKTASCSEIGWAAYDTCSRCDYTTYAETPATGHTWNSGTVTTAATCTIAGVKTFTCTACGATKTDSITVLGHDWSAEKSVIRAPTVTSTGLKAYICSLCGAHKDEETIPMIVHTWDNGVIITAPTCTASGALLYKCLTCGETKRESVSALGHNWSAKRIIIQAPTQTATGVEAYVCSRCGEEKDRVIIPRLDPTITASNVSGRPGKTVDVKLTVKDNPGIAGALLSLNYEGPLSLQKITVGDAWNELTFTQPGDLIANPINLLWDGIEADSTNGLILTLTFEIPAETEEAEYAVILNYLPGAIFDGNIEDVTFTINSGKVVVRNTSPGDLDGDGYVNAKDITILRRALAGGYGLTVDLTSADFNHDGYTNAKDVTILRRALAGGYGVNLE